MGFHCHYTSGSLVKPFHITVYVVVGTTRFFAVHGKILALFPFTWLHRHLAGRGQCFVKEHFASWKLFSGPKAWSCVHGRQSNGLTLTIDLSGSTRTVFRRKNDRHQT